MDRQQIVSKAADDNLDGNPSVDTDGNPIMETVNDLDDDGNIVMIANPNLATAWPDPDRMTFLAGVATGVLLVLGWALLSIAAE